MHSFTYNTAPARVIFGRGSLDTVGAEVQRLGKSRALLLSTPEQADQVGALGQRLGELSAGVFSEAAMHTPVEVTGRAVAHARELGADCTVALGGGSTTGLGKAIAFRMGLPQIVVPTTYAGSEATNILGETRDGVKATQRSAQVLPEVIIYDVDLTLTLPARLSATSGMNAIAHAVEALYAKDGNPVVALMAEEGVRALAGSLPAILADPGGVDARSEALYGAWLCGTCLNAVSMALHHKLCHTLGGSFDLPHADTHTVVLPHATAFNTEAAPQAMSRLARALGSAEAAPGLFDLAERLGAPLSLAALGFKESDIDRAADLALENPYWNPRSIDRDGVRALIEDAYHGRRPNLGG